MIWRPGKVNKRRQAGGCMVVIGIFMALIGLAVAGFAYFHDAASGEVAWEALKGVIFGLAMLVVGASLIVLGFFRSLHASPDPVPPGDWRQNPFFPNLGKCREEVPGGAQLVASVGPMAQFMGLLLFTVIWDGVIAIVLFNALPGILRERQYLPLMFISIFVLVGILLIWGVVYQFLRVILVGTPSIHLSSEPVRPGATVRYRVFTNGNYPVNRVAIRLLCRETVTYRQGTDTRTATHDVLEAPLLEMHGIEGHKGEPLCGGEFVVPSDAMHSFRAKNNRISWLLELVLDIPGRPDVKDLIEFRVLPEAPAE